MTPTEFIAEQAPERQAFLTALHNIILKTNTKVVPEVAPMMGKEIIQYKLYPMGVNATMSPKESSRYFVYGLASTKNYMSIHAMPMYAHKPIHEKFSKLLKKAKFQKGCINFKNVDEMPLDIAEQFMAACAEIDWAAVMKKYGK
ncbi:MAG TPA: hypothetical protein VK809_00070 [Bacteroidia bacterium]|jgi:hypothetical protein|nr:hypothetical protein [Bacteroidia bacterium]